MEGSERKTASSYGTSDIAAAKPGCSRDNGEEVLKNVVHGSIAENESQVLPSKRKRKVGPTNKSPYVVPKTPKRIKRTSVKGSK